MKKCQGGELNSRPTPNAFGAALPLEMINGELGIFLCFQDALQLASLRQCFRLFLGNNFEFLAEAFGCCRVASQMLRETRFQINSRANVVADQMILSEHIPKAWYSYQGGELNSRPRAYESPALPLSYPGFRIS